VTGAPAGILRRLSPKAGGSASPPRTDAVPERSFVFLQGQEDSAVGSGPRIFLEALPPATGSR
jgi:hypothetical protein